MKIVTLFFLLTFSHYFVSSLDATTCSTYSCFGHPPAGTCSERTVRPDYDSYTFEICPKDKPYCPFKKSGQYAQCEVLNTTFPRYPGSACDDTNPCVFGKCDAGICKVQDDDKCNSHRECKLGYACYKNDSGVLTCQQQKQKGKPCNDSFECLNNLACNSITKLCSDLFVVDNEQETVEIQELEFKLNNVSFCKSGISVYEDGKLKCKSVKLKEQKKCQTDDDCVYVVQSAQTNIFNAEQTITLADSCECGYNKDASKYCKTNDVLGYISQLSSTLSANNCHTLERFNCYNSYLTSKKNFNLLERSKINNLYSHKLIGSDICVNKVVFPFYNIDKCPAFTCSNTPSKQCAVAKGLISEDRSVILSKCNVDKEKCIIQGQDYSKIVSDDDFSQDCSASTPSKIEALPGETCKVDPDCASVDVYYQDDQKVTQKATINQCKTKCLGASDTVTINGKDTKTTLDCKVDDTCISGTFCLLTKDTELGKCTAQYEKGKSCQNTSQCKNSLICFGKTNDTKICSDFFSAKLGEENVVEQTYQGLVCDKGIYENGKCLKEKYSTSQPKTKGVAKCDYNSDCNYDYFDANDVKVTQKSKKCECGFNSLGQGYCPYAQNDADLEERLTKVNKLSFGKYNNTLHTLHRDGGENPNVPNFCLPYLQSSSYEGAVPCAVSILNFENCKLPDPGSSSDLSTTNYLVSLFSIVMLALIF